MIGRLFIAVIIFLATFGLARAGWEGNWDSSYGQLRLVTSGDRVFGDYADIGTIEGRVGPDGRTLRGVFLYRDGRWGSFEWLRSGDRFAGTWRWNASGVTRAGDQKWSGTRTSARTSPLRYADVEAIAYPLGDVNFQEGGFTAFLDHRDAGGARPARNDPRDELGVWYGRHELSNLDGAFEIAAEIIQLRNDDTGFVDLSMYARPDAGCPDAMHARFCRELRAAADGRGFVPAEVTGARRVRQIDGLGKDDFLIAFRLPGDGRDRLLALREEATYRSASIHHPQRGFDYSGFAQRSAHSCEISACANDVFAGLERDSSRYLGALNGVAWTRALREMPDRIAQSHGSRPSPAPRPVANGGSGDWRPLMGDPWTIFEETDEPLGTVSFEPRANGLFASGQMLGFFETGRPQEAEFRLAAQTDQAVAFDVTIYAGESGERRTGRLMVELPSHASGDPRGTLVVDDEIFLVYLAPQRRGGGGGPVAREDDLIDPREPLPEYPVIGIYKYDYVLRDVPAGRELALRYQPSRDSGQVGQIASGTGPFQLHTCRPEIESYRFEEASPSEQLRLLSSGWCEALTPNGRGWIPGRYLQPVEPRP